MVDRLLKDIEMRLAGRLSDADREAAMQCIMVSLKNYDVSEKQTDLVVRHEDTNERLMRRFAACLRLDGKSEGTIKQYVWTLRSLSDTIGSPFTEMGVYEIRYYLGTMKERGCKNQTIANQRANLSAFFGWMMQEEIIAKNPCDKIRPVKVEKVVRQSFSPVEIDKLRMACKKHRDRAIMEVALSSGLRCEELTNLTLADIDMTSKKIFVRCGKGGKDRVCYMSDIACEHLGTYLSARKQASTTVFCNPNGQKLTPHAIEQMFKGLGKKAGVENVHPHRFRRTFATNMFKRGMDILTISQLMGHSNIETTKRYIVIDCDQVQSEYKKYSA